MADIRFRCPACGAKLSIDHESIDLVVDCPVCHTSIRAWGAPLLDVRFRCASCRTKLVIDAQAAGREIVCPSCERLVMVPQPFDGAEEAKISRANPAPVKPLLTDDEVRFLAGDGPAKA